MTFTSDGTPYKVEDDRPAGMGSYTPITEDMLSAWETAAKTDAVKTATGRESDDFLGFVGLVANEDGTNLGLGKLEENKYL